LFKLSIFSSWYLSTQIFPECIYIYTRISHVISCPNKSLTRYVCNERDSFGQRRNSIDVIVCYDKRNTSTWQSPLESPCSLDEGTGTRPDYLVNHVQKKWSVPALPCLLVSQPPSFAHQPINCPSTGHLVCKADILKTRHSTQPLGPFD